MNKATCRGCGAPIVWIKTPAGKAMPCDPAPVYYKATPNGKDKVVTNRGEVVSCEIVPGADYTGEDGSMGFKNGRHYRIFISRGNGHRTVVVRTEEGLLRCPYHSMMSVLQYWKIIEIGW